MNFLEDSTGGTSTMRLLTFIIVCTVMLVWALTSIRSGAMLDMPPMALGLITAALGAKIIQRRIEDQGATPAPGPKA